MALDLEAERDLTLIFERGDVREALTTHCGDPHTAAAMHKCQRCLRLTALLAMAITEWLGIVDQDRAARLPPPPSPGDPT